MGAMTQVAIEPLLQQKIGLDARTIGTGTIARAIQQRMAACGLTDMPSYLTLLQSSNQELEELIEAVVIPETWFFRYREPFVFLSRHVVSEWLPARANDVLRVLSVPCSTGEEPYSIAITLIEAGLSTKNFCIDAVDISKKSLQKARRAVYSRNSFRGEDLEFQKSYFSQIENEYQLHDLVKNTVNFIHSNLLDPNFLKDKNPYDVIFCRNLLIYLDRTAREKSFQALERLLKNQGLLFLGHSETAQMYSSRFVSVRHPSAFAYRKVEDKSLDLKKNQTKNMIKPLANISKTQANLDTKKNVNRLIDNSKAVKSQHKRLQAQTSTKPTTHNSPDLSDSNLKTARAFADRGQFHQAISICLHYLNQNPTSAEAYVLLGQAHQAVENQEQAEQCFQKATYLEPNYYEALIHLALIKEDRGEISKAAVIRQRIQRLQNIIEQ